MKTSLSKTKIFLIVVALLVIALVSYLFAQLIFMLALSVLISLIFVPVVTFLEKYKFSRILATLTVFVAFGFLLYLGFSIFIPKIGSQLNSLIVKLSEVSVEDQIVKAEHKVREIFPFISEGMIVHKAESFLTKFAEESIVNFASFLGSVFSMAAVIFLMPFIIFFLIKDRDKLIKGMITFLPNKYFEMSYWIINKITMQLGHFVRGWIFDATYVGFACGLAFYLIGVENAVALGVIAGVGHLVPYLGPVIGGIPALLISLLQYGNLSAAPLIILALTIIYVTDNGFVQPYVFSKQINLHPLLIIVLIIAGGQLLGIVGMIFAVPTATVVKTAAQEIYFVFKNYNIAKV